MNMLARILVHAAALIAVLAVPAVQAALQIPSDQGRCAAGSRARQALMR